MSSSEASVASIGRLPLYLRVLTALGEQGVPTVSSEALAEAAGVQPALVRRDLSQFGSYGTRGVGYHVPLLTDEIQRIVGGTHVRRVVLVGVGRLGQALMGHAGLGDHRFEVVALVDIADDVVGTEVNGVRVDHQDDLARVIQNSGAELAIIATPASAAQEVTDALLAAGVTSILNMAPTTVHVPAGVTVRSVDFAQELQILSYHHVRRDAQSSAESGASHD